MSQKRGRLRGRGRRTLLVADLFCGAGGSSTGCRRALKRRGIRMKLRAVNHWPLAIETHQKNHPDADHYCVNLDAARPRELVPEGRLDLLMASPECTHHSTARGGRPISDQSRMSAWHVIRWATELQVRVILVENVPEFQTWGPLDENDRPIKERKGEYFRAWLFALEQIGFKVEYRVLNAADYGDATTRQRFFLIARSDGELIRWPAKTHSKNGKGWRRWRPASEVINWELKGRSIFSREKPLAAKTMQRIYAGAVKFGWSEPYLVVLRQHCAARGIDLPLPTIAAQGNHVGLAQPVRDDGKPIVFQVNQGDGRKRNMRTVDQPLQTIVTRPSLGVTEPVPLILPQNGSNGPKTVDEPTPTITTTSRGIALVTGKKGDGKPFVCGNRTHNVGKDPEKDPLPTATTTTGGGLFLVEPVTKGGKPFVLNRHGENGSNRARSVEDPLPTATTRGAGYVVDPVEQTSEQALVMRADCQGGNGLNVRTSEEPVYTPTTNGGLALVVPQGGGGAPRPTDAPLPTIHTDGAISLVAPYYKSGRARSVKQPLPTITTKDRHALVTPVTHHDKSQRSRSVEDPLPTVTSAPRGELALVEAKRRGRAFMPDAFGERPTQTPRVRSVKEPVATICAQGRTNLVEEAPSLPWEEAHGVDILFRMLEPSELAAAMGFSDDESTYEFCGNKTEITKQVGNAVPVRLAAALVGAIFGAKRRTARRRRLAG